MIDEALSEWDDQCTTRVRCRNCSHHVLAHVHEQGNSRACMLCDTCDEFRDDVPASDELRPWEERLSVPIIYG